MRRSSMGRLLHPFTSIPMSLRSKFIVVIMTIQFVVMGLVTLIVEKHQREIILQESRKRALSLAVNFAALNEGYLLSYNYIKLEQSVEKIINEEDVVYAIVHLHDGQVAASSGSPPQQGKVLDDAVSRQALLAGKPFIQGVTTAAIKGRGYDVAIPVFTPGGTRKWGTIRLGFSLARALDEIRQTRRDILLLGVVAIALSTGGAIFLAMRISKPIQQLVIGVNEVAKGNYHYSIAVTVQDEVGQLAKQVEKMRDTLRDQLTTLAEEKQRLELTNKMLKDAQEQLIQGEKLAAAGKLAAKVAHEVNNPLAIIKTSFQILNEKIPVDDPIKEDLTMIEEEIDRITRTIRHLHDFARPQSDITTLQVNEVMRNLVKLTEKELLNHHIRIVLDLDPEVKDIQMSLDHLKQVLLNLVKNAQEAMPTGGTLCLQTAKQREGILVKVIDDGVGIPEAHLHSIFEPFFSTKKTSGGMGLGLAVIYGIIKSYGGSVEVESQLGKGTVFQLFLPENPAIIRRQHLQATDPPGQQKEHHTWWQEVS